MQEITLMFRGRTPQQVNQIATKLKSRAMEVGGYVGMTFSPPVRAEPLVEPDRTLSSDRRAVAPPPPLPGESEVDYSARKARLAAQAVEARKLIADAETPVESPIVKFNRVFED